MSAEKFSTSLLRTFEAINFINRPERLAASQSFLYQVKQLPTQGKVHKSIWKGDYWPASRHGTASRKYGSLSPMEKYDQAMNQSPQATQWEISESKNSRGLSWSGHCNGLAAASINTPEPQKAVNFRGVLFNPIDIKALLIEAYQGRCQETELVGRRVFFDFPEFRRGRSFVADLRDINPGAFHLLLANKVGRLGQSFVLDLTAGSAVWNYPVVSFSSSFHPLSYRQVESMGLLYNPEAQSFTQVKTKVQFPHTAKTYQYILELDADENIIGGEWIGSSITSHPDFAWTMERPCAANPFLDIEIIFEIASLSY